MNIILYIDSGDWIVHHLLRTAGQLNDMQKALDETRRT